MEFMSTPVLLPLLLDESQSRQDIEGELEKALLSTGFEGLKDLLEMEIRVYPRCRSLFASLSADARTRLWARVAEYS